MLLVFLDFNINLGRSKIGLLPDFIGYIVMAGGLAELQSESESFAKVKGFAKGMAVYSGILYLLDLLGFSFSLNIVSYLLGLVSTIISLYISHGVVRGVQDMELARGMELNGASLYSAWKVKAGFILAAYLLIILPPLSIICILVSFIAAIVFLVALNRSKKLYYGTWY